MRTLSSTLLSAQKGASGKPYLRVEVLDRFVGVARPALARLYTGSEPDFHHHCTMPGDGSLVRARTEPAGSLYIQRVANPGSGSNFGSWTLLNNASTLAGIALASLGAQVRLFYVDYYDGKTMYQRISNDYGANWGASQIIINPAVAGVRYLAAAIKSGGVVTLFFASTEPRVYVMQNSGSGWSMPAEWSNSVGVISGLACHYQGDWNLAVAGKTPGGESKVWSCIYGDGSVQSSGTWSSLREITTAASDSQISFQRVFVGLPDVYRLFCVEVYGGSVSYNRPLWSHLAAGSTFGDNRWREPVPFNLSSQYGVALTGTATTLWLTTPSGVWKGDLATPTLELTADLLRLETLEASRSGEAKVVLYNGHGRYNSPGSGQTAALKRGAELRISPGYYTSAGAEYSQGPSFYVENWEHHTTSGRRELHLYGRSPWGILERWYTRRQYTWTAGQATILEILRFLLGRTGLPLTTLSTSGTITTHSPAFTVHPGESGKSAVGRLLAMVPDLIFFRGFTATLLYPQASDSSAYAYGTDHLLRQGRYRSLLLEENRVQVFGSVDMAEEFQWDQVNVVGDRLRQVHDLNLDTTTKVQQRAQGELRHRLLEPPTGAIEVPVNCGQEVYDVVTVTDPGAGLTSARYRIQSIALEHARDTRARYQQRLELGEV